MLVKLGESLVRKGFISEGQLSEALVRQSEGGGLLGSILVDMGFVRTEQVRQVLTRKYGGIAISLTDVDIDPALAELISEDTARAYQVVPIARARGRIAVAMADPTNVEVADELRFLTGYVIEPMMAPAAEVAQKIDAFYAGVSGATRCGQAIPVEAGPRLRRAAELEERAKSLLTYDRYEEATAVQEDALAAYQTALGPNHFGVAKARSRLGYAYLLQERFDAAERALDDARAVMEATSGDEPLELANTLNNLGVVLNQRGRNSDAQACFERALEIEREVLGAEHPETGVTMLNLAHTRTRQRRFAEAEPLFERAVKLLDASSRSPRRALAEAKAGLATCRWTRRALPSSEL